MQISAVTQKGQATIPAEIRQKFNLHGGDKIGFKRSNYEYHKSLESTLTEWSSPEDDEAFKSL